MRSRFPLLALAFSLFLFVGCDSDSTDDNDDGGNGNGAGNEVYGVIATSTGSDEFTIDYEYNYCEVGVSDADCAAGFSGGGTSTPFGTRPFLIIETSTDRDVDRIYLDWSITSGEGRLDIVRATVDEDDDATVSETFESLTVSAGDQGASVYALD